MEGYLKTYKLRFRTIGPVFIGSGDKIGKKDYILDRETAHIPDLVKMYDGIKKMKLTDSFEDFYIRANYKSSLAEWMRMNNIQKKDYMPWVSYSLDFADVESSEGKSPAREIMTFIKDAYGQPYVPGSSIKGALRTALLTRMILMNPKPAKTHADNIQIKIDSDARKRIDSRADKKYLKDETVSLEATFFNRLKRKEDRKNDAVNDMMAGVIISDSKPLSTEDLILCQKVDLSTENKETDMPILRECIRPGTDIECTISIDTSLEKKFSAKGIVNAVNDTAEFYNKVFRSHFDLPDIDAPQDGIIYLGGGSGYLTKTVTYPLFGAKRGVNNTVEVFRHTMKYDDFRKHKHDNDIKQGISPHMCKITYCDGKPLEFGRCRMSISE